LLEWKKKKTVKRTFLAQDCRSVERASAKIYASPRNGAKFPTAGPAPVLSERFSRGTDLRHSTNAAHKPGKWLAKAQHSVSVLTLRGASAKYNVSSIETPSTGPSALAEARFSASARQLSRLTTPTGWFAFPHVGRVALNAKTQRWRHKKQGTREGCLREFPLNLKW